MHKYWNWKKFKSNWLKIKYDLLFTFCSQSPNCIDSNASDATSLKKLQKTKLIDIVFYFKNSVILDYLLQL